MEECEGLGPWARMYKSVRECQEIGELDIGLATLDDGNRASQA